MDLNLVNRNALALTGIKKIKTTEPSQIVAILDTCTVVITGQNLSVQNVSISNGNMEVTGQVNSIKYTQTHSRRFSIRNIFR